MSLLFTEANTREARLYVKGRAKRKKLTTATKKKMRKREEGQKVNINGDENLHKENVEKKP